MTTYKTAQPMRVQVRPGSPAAKTYQWAALPGKTWAMPKVIAPGIDPAPLEDLIFHGGKVVPQMVFQNVYLGGHAAWTAKDVSSIDTAILRAMQHKGLNNMLAQYFTGRTATCDKRESVFFEDPNLAKIDEPDVQRLVTALYDQGLIDQSDLDSCIVNLLLPPGSILKLGKDTSMGGLGGYHGSFHIRRKNRKVTLYYSANVYSQMIGGKENGINVFDAPWKNVVGTLYHEINEFRTDADVNDAIEHNSNDFLGWNSRSGSEIGDQPIFAASSDLRLVFQEISAPRSRVKIPVQFLYSNAVHGAEGPIAKPRP